MMDCNFNGGGLGATGSTATSVAFVRVAATIALVSIAGATTGCGAAATAGVEFDFVGSVEAGCAVVVFVEADSLDLVSLFLRVACPIRKAPSPTRITMT